MKTVQKAERSSGRIAYWVATILVCAELLTGGSMDLLRTHYVVGIMTRLGYPLYVLTILGVWKILGIPALLAPGLPRLKEWAYAGIFFDMSGALFSHAICGEFSATLAPIVIAGLAMVSWQLRPQSRTCGAILAETRVKVGDGSEGLAGRAL